MTLQKHTLATVRFGAGTLLAITSLLASCANDPTGKGAEANAAKSGLMPRTVASAPAVSGVTVEPKEQPKADEDRVKMALGSGRTYRIPQPPAAPAPDSSSLVTLTFENGDIREIVKNLLGDLLNESFIIDPAVTGTVTVRTARGIRRSDVIPTLETLLRSVKAVLVRDGAYWRVLPEGGANLGTNPPRAQLRSGAGASVVILPVKFIGAKELERVMLPFVKVTTPPAIRVDELRNLLFLSGTEAEIRNLLEIAEMFDVNLMMGMSFLLYPLESADVKTVAADWEKIFPAATNPFAGLLRIVPIERMNAILLISPQRDVILEARQWLERLDKGTDAGGGARLYVYYVQYGQADKLQAILQQAITGRATPSTQATVAPGQSVSTLTQPPVSPIVGQPVFTPGNTLNNPPPTVARPVIATSAAGTANQAIGLARNATVIADKDRNALLIVGTPSEYAAIEAAIKKLDTPPKQIAIEVQIAQIQLTGDLSFGLSGLFTGKPESPANRMTSENGVGTLGRDSLSGLSSGFNYTGAVGNAVKAALDTLQSTKQIRTIASPTLITLDNQKASFTSGQQISVVTGTVTTPTTTGNTTTNTTQYIPTGVTLNVTPRVSGTNVFLDIQQQISSSTPSASGTNPDIDQKSVSTTVMVASGDTILMGGFIQDKGGNSTAGVPLLSTIPVLGGLFGTQGWNSDRSELVMLITPRIMTTPEETRGIVDELRQKMSKVESLLPQISTAELPASGEAHKAIKDRRAAEKIPSEFNQSLRIPAGNSQP